MDGVVRCMAEEYGLEIREVNKFLVQCHRIAPSLTAIQVSMLFTMFDHDEPMTQQELANELGIKPAMINRYLKPLFDQSGREMVVMNGWNCLYLTERGERYCRSLITNTRHFFST